jgi:cytochrome c oxidase subunit 2
MQVQGRKARWVSAALALVWLAAGAAAAAQDTGPVAWGQHAFRSNGERLYFTATSERGTALAARGGPRGTDWLALPGRLACASCHGVDGRGGRRPSGAGQWMDARDIRWSVLKDEFDQRSLAVALRTGLRPDGRAMSADMPRWDLDEDDMADLVAYLMTLP